MTTPFTVDDDAPEVGMRAICFPGDGLAATDCRTLGYTCKVLGQVRKRRSRQLEKCFLVHLDFFDAPFIAKESELVPCTAGDEPPIRSQEEIVIAWRDLGGRDPQVSGMYRTSPWVPRTSFLVRHGDTAVGRHRALQNGDGTESLLYEAPPGTVLDDQYLVEALSLVTGQRLWRVLPSFS